MIKLLSLRTESSLVSIRLRSTLRPFSILPLLLWLLSTPGANAAIETAKPSDDFVESVGVVTHIPYTGGAYGNYTGVVKPRLIELGVRYIRDGIVARGSQFGRDAFATKLLDLQTTTGIKAVLLFSGDSMTTVSNFLTSCSAAVIGVEGPNEPDLSKYNFIYNGNGWQGGVAVGQGWAVGAKNYQTDLFNLVNNTPAFNNWDILQMSMGWGGNASSVGNHEAFADLGNFHWYVQTAYPPELPGQLDWLINSARIISPTKQLMPTESGYPAVSAASEAVHGRYVMRTLCEGFRRNFKRTFIYELIDENTTDKFGLLRNNNTARPAFTGIKNLITLLKDTGAPFTPGSLNYTVTDSSTAYPTDSAGLRRFLVQKSDGRFLLVIWHAAKSGWGNGNPITVPNRSVTIGFASTYGSIKTYLPLNGSTAVQTFTNTNSVVVQVPDHPLVIEITPTTLITVPASATDTGLAINTWQSYPAIGGGFSSTWAGTGTSALIKSGYRNANGNPAFCLVIPFQLPNLGSSPTIASAILNIKALPNTTAFWGSHDLYGIGARIFNAVLPSDLYIGSSDTTDAVKIIENAITSLASEQQLTFDVTAYVQQQYQLQGAGKFIFIRINPDSKPPATNGEFGLAVRSSESVNTADRPSVTISVGP